MPSIPSRFARRQATDSAATETNSESSRASATEGIFSDNESVSQTTNQTDVDSNSEMSSSSEEPSSESEDDSDDESDSTDRASARNEDEITNLRPGTKPEMKLGALGGGLLQRLKTFLPALEAANQELEKEKRDGTIERRNIERIEEGDRPFIELDLGLGVLEQKPDGITTSTHDSNSDSDEHDEDTTSEKKDSNVISKLMGQATKKQKQAHIEDLGE